MLSSSAHMYDFWSFAEKTFVKQSMMLCAFEILLKIGWFEGGVNRTGDLGVNRTWRFEGKLSVRFTPPEIVMSNLVTWDSLSDI